MLRKHGVGLLYTLGDVGSATAALLRVAHEKPLQKALSEQALHSQLHKFSSKVVAMETAAIYKKVLKE